MKKLGFGLVMALLLSGCATMTTSDLAANNSMNLVHLSRGMGRSEALGIMGSRISVYNCDHTTLKNPPRIKISTPYRTETVETAGRTLEVVYYVTSLNSGNCAVEEANLTPLVFDDGKLIGWGKAFLSEVTTKPAPAAQPAPAK
ncbi:MAG: DUF3192 domain-containing protein [Candidatus Omnitrophica bacterium]|nr:DUF3192 domain-containing protein [Candidatus Omnitrophota bacterium]